MSWNPRAPESPAALRASINGPEIVIIGERNPQPMIPLGANPDWVEVTVNGKVSRQDLEKSARSP